jgi:probable phosphoglycerate mutase
MKGRAMLIMARHGETIRNAHPERIRGWDDVDLNAKGLKEAERLAKKLSLYRISTIYSSNLKRALETARAIQAANKSHPKPKIVPTVALRPWNLGTFQGMVYADVKKLVEHHQLVAPNKKVPGGESFHQFLARYMGFMKKKLAEAQRTGGLILFVAHTRNVRAFKSWAPEGLKGALVNLEHMVKQDDSPTGGATVVETVNGKTSISEL